MNAAEYQQTARDVAFSIAAQAMSMDEMPEELLESYLALTEKLLADEEQIFELAWQSLPNSARQLISQSVFHGVFIAKVWMNLAMAAQEMVQWDDMEAVHEQEKAGLLDSLIAAALKDSLKQLKKARTDFSLRHWFTELNQLSNEKPT